MDGRYSGVFVEQGDEGRFQPSKNSRVQFFLCVVDFLHDPIAC